MSLDTAAARERTQKEASAGIVAARKLRGDLKSVISGNLNSRSGALSNINTVKKMSRGRLRGITIRAPKYGYIHNYGFIGTKSNGVFQRLKGISFVDKAVNAGSIEKLATEISDIRAEEVVANITL